MTLPPRRVVFALTLSLLPALAAADPMPWRTDLVAAQAEAQRDGKLVLVHFWTESCGPCRLLEKRVFSEPGAVQAIVRDYVPVKVNARTESAIAQRFRVTRVPTDVVITPAGQFVKSFVSPATPVAYVAAVSEIASSRLAGRAGYQSVAAAAPFQATPSSQQLPGSTEVLNPAYGQLQVTAAAAAPPASVAAPAAVEPKPQITINPAYTAATTAAPQQAAATPPPVVAPPAAAPQTPAAPPTVAAQPPTAARQPPTVASRLPAGSPPLGFDGYCPVTLRREWRWAKGDPQWGAIHRGRTYLFVNEQSRNEFLKSPDAFSPALSGNDAVLVAEASQAVPGMREHGVEFEGRYYLFSSKETFDKFWSDPESYAQKAAQRVAAAPPAGATQVR